MLNIGQIVIFSAAGLLLTSLPALATYCQPHKERVDKSLAENPPLSEAQLKEVKRLREAGEKSDKAGHQQDCIDALTDAEKILKLR